MRSHVRVSGSAKVIYFLKWYGQFCWYLLVPTIVSCICTLFHAELSLPKIPLYPLATHTYAVTWLGFQVLQREFISQNGMDSFVGDS